MTLFIVGLGIKSLSHITKESEKIINTSDKVFYLTNDSLYSEWIQGQNKNSESLDDLYFSHDKRDGSYNLIARKVLSELKKTNNLCFAIYGHPTFLVQATKMITDKASKNGYNYHILPAVSSFDCLIAELGINPGDGGMQMYDATEFVVFNKSIDLTSHLIIFQISAVGLQGHLKDFDKARRGLSILSSKLKSYYNGEAVIYLYEASKYPGRRSKVVKAKLSELEFQEVSSLTTLYIPPLHEKQKDEVLAKEIELLFADPYTAP